MHVFSTQPSSRRRLISCSKFVVTTPLLIRWMLTDTRSTASSETRLWRCVRLILRAFLKVTGSTTPLSSLTVLALPVPSVIRLIPMERPRSSRATFRPRASSTSSSPGCTSARTRRSTPSSGPQQDQYLRNWTTRTMPAPTGNGITPTTALAVSQWARCSTSSSLPSGIKRAIFCCQTW